MTGTTATASATVGSTTENRVKAIAAETINAVGAGEHIAAGQRRGETPPQLRPAEGRGVHTYYVIPTAREGTTTGPGVVVHNCGGVTPEDLTARSSDELRQLAQERGYEPHGLADAAGNYRKLRDPVTKAPRLRLDEGHVDPVTGQPYNDPRAAVPHAHGYDANGNPVVDPESGNKHFPLR